MVLYNYISTDPELLTFIPTLSSLYLWYQDPNETVDTDSIENESFNNKRLYQYHED